MLPLSLLPRIRHRTIQTAQVEIKTQKKTMTTTMQMTTRSLLLMRRKMHKQAGRAKVAPRSARPKSALKLRAAKVGAPVPQARPFRRGRQVTESAAMRGSTAGLAPRPACRKASRSNLRQPLRVCLRAPGARKAVAFRGSVSRSAPPREKARERTTTPRRPGPSNSAPLRARSGRSRSLHGHSAGSASPLRGLAPQKENYAPADDKGMFKSDNATQVASSI